MNIALLTGATSGIGKAICNMLLNDGFCVYGIGRDFSKIPDICARENFHSITCDLLDTKKRKAFLYRKQTRILICS